VDLDWQEYEVWEILRYWIKIWGYFRVESGGFRIWDTDIRGLEN